MSAPVPYAGIPVAAVLPPEVASGSEPLRPSFNFINWQEEFLKGLFPPETELLARADDKKLLYAGRIHSFIGEPESLKSWLLLFCVVQEIKGGNSVLFLDYEDGYTSVGTRLLQMGLTEIEIHGGFLYVRVDDKFNAADAELLEGLVQDYAESDAPITLCGIDGVTEAMSIENFRTSDDDGVANFLRLLPRFVASLGLAVVMVDHVVKNKQDRGVDARGSGQKRAGIDGSSFMIEKRQEFAPGKHGVAYINIAKDRPGGVRAFCNGNRAGVFHIVSNPTTGTIDAWIDVPEVLADTVTHNGVSFKAAQIQAVLAKILAKPGCNKKDATDGVEGLTHNPVKIALIDYILAEKYAVDTGLGGPRAEKRLKFLKDYSTEVVGLEDLD